MEFIPNFYQDVSFYREEYKAFTSCGTTMSSCVIVNPHTTHVLWIQSHIFYGMWMADIGVNEKGRVFFLVIY